MLSSSHSFSLLTAIFSFIHYSRFDPKFLQFARRYCVKAQSFYQSKEAKTKPVVAIKALSNKLSKASYYIMRDQVAFDEEKLFG